MFKREPRIDDGAQSPGLRINDNHSAFASGVFRNLAKRFFQSAFDDVNANLFVFVIKLQAFQRFRRRLL